MIPSNTAAAFRFNPDKDTDEDGNHSGRTNGQRAETAYRVLLFYKQRLGESGRVDKSSVIDLITDIGHLCDGGGEDFESILRSVVGHWEAER